MCYFICKYKYSKLRVFFCIYDREYFRCNNGGILTVINIACFHFLSGCVYAGCVLLCALVKYGPYGLTSGDCGVLELV
jgi:hypothetical protein